MMADTHHRLPTALWTPSPNCAPRIENCAPELIVLHCVSLPEGEYATGAPQRLFLNQLDINEHPSFHDLEGMRVSPHLFMALCSNLLDSTIKLGMQAFPVGSIEIAVTATVSALSLKARQHPTSLMRSIIR